MSFSLARFTRAFRPASVRCLSTHATAQSARRRYLPTLFIAGALVAAGAYTNTVHLDSPPVVVSKDAVEDTVVDPATSIAFPKIMRIPSNTKTPPLTLVGVGVRTVSFLGVKVYSIAFYADLNNPHLKSVSQVPLDIEPEEKVKCIVQNTACVVRIVPTRSTSYTHLRDAFMRALQARLSRGIKEGTITEDTAMGASSPMRVLKGLFPNSPLAKHVPLDIYLPAPDPNRPRALIFRDLGSIENDWVATEFVLNYFDKEGPSPPLKNSVFENLKSFQR
ncbi:hypothetical protein JR316_0001161 [Psilocybe cubensis]|uniref:Uncharacterized protein n=2 Tax=Psilocybe cubensis TaxID=181762 RepID=A0ACB8HGZ7_PSICU|nr:hypothetical protein JR316_0001161 [Psilocybe cubensis]KAH9487093.1 hypothetical protein JR316_0001161 [Psilocybe cubensis]